MNRSYNSSKATTAINGPKSFCDCGHTGDGPNSQHGDRFSRGHGPCLVKGCDCKQFSWAKWIRKPSA